MARPVNRDAKRQQLLHAAARCFARSGYDATSMSDVAIAAGVSKGSLYDYFADKEDLFFAVFDWFQQQLADAAGIGEASAVSPRGQIVAAIEAVSGSLAEHRAFYPLSLEVWAATARTGMSERFSKAVRELYAGYRKDLSDLIKAAQQAGEIKRNADPEILAAMLIGAIDGLVFQYWLSPDFDPRKWIRVFLANLFGGIATDTRQP